MGVRFPDHVGNPPKRKRAQNMGQERPVKTKRDMIVTRMTIVSGDPRVIEVEAEDFMNESVKFASMGTPQDPVPAIGTVVTVTIEWPT
jgi:hypothetical protein